METETVDFNTVADALLGTSDRSKRVFKDIMSRMSVDFLNRIASYHTERLSVISEELRKRRMIGDREELVAIGPQTNGLQSNAFPALDELPVVNI